MEHILNLISCSHSLLDRVFVFGGTSQVIQKVYNVLACVQNIKLQHFAKTIRFNVIRLYDKSAIFTQQIDKSCRQCF